MITSKELLQSQSS